MRYDPPSWRRWNPPGPHWKSVRFYPPENGRQYKVRLEPNGPEFEAIKTYSMHGWVRANDRTQKFESSPQMEYFA